MNDPKPVAPLKIFEWYQAILQSGQFVEKDGGTTFYETTKLHLAIVAGALVLASYGFTKQEPRIFILPVIVSAFGALNTISWFQQVLANNYWQKRWYRLVGEMEDLPEFEVAVGTSSFKAFANLNKEGRTKVGGRTLRFRVTTIATFFLFYLILGPFSFAEYKKPLRTSIPQTTEAVPAPVTAPSTSTSPPP